MSPPIPVSPANGSRLEKDGRAQPGHGSCAAYRTPGGMTSMRQPTCRRRQGTAWRVQRLAMAQPGHERAGCSAVSQQAAVRPRARATGAAAAGGGGKVLRRPPTPASAAHVSLDVLWPLAVAAAVPAGRPPRAGPHSGRSAHLGVPHEVHCASRYRAALQLLLAVQNEHRAGRGAANQPQQQGCQAPHHLEDSLTSSGSGWRVRLEPVKMCPSTLAPPLAAAAEPPAVRCPSPAPSPLVLGCSLGVLSC